MTEFLKWYFSLDFGETILFAFKFMLLGALVWAVAATVTGTAKLAYHSKIKPALKKWTERKPETDTARKAA